MSLLRTTIELLNQTLGRLKAGRRLRLPSDAPTVKLNLGCGLTVAPGWINIDGSLNALVASMPFLFHKPMYNLTGAKQHFSREEYCLLLGNHMFLHHDLTFGIPYQDNSAEFIFTSHFLEHLYAEDAKALLRESYRVLKPEGRIRISIPDLSYAVGLYNLGYKEQMLKNYFFVERRDSHYARHKYMYDYEMLANILSDLGFKDINRCEYRNGLVPDIDILDNRPEESLFVEAVK